MFYTTKSLKKDIKKRAKELDISMSDYIRTLVKKDIKECEIVSNNFNREKIDFDIDNFNKKLSGYYKDLRWVKFMN